MDELHAFTVEQFCLMHSISRTTFYNLINSGNGPLTFKAGARTLISGEAARAWRRKMERRTRDRLRIEKQPA